MLPHTQPLTSVFVVWQLEDGSHMRLGYASGATTATNRVSRIVGLVSPLHFQVTLIQLNWRVSTNFARVGSTSSAATRAARAVTIDFAAHTRVAAALIPRLFLPRLSNFLTSLCYFFEWNSNDFLRTTLAAKWIESWSMLQSASTALARKLTEPASTCPARPTPPHPATCPPSVPEPGR